MLSEASVSLATDASLSMTRPALSVHIHDRPNWKRRDPLFTNRRFLMRDHAASTTTIPTRGNTHNTKSHGSLDADIIIKNAPDPVFVSDLEGKILSANDAVYELLGFRTDEVL